MDGTSNDSPAENLAEVVGNAPRRSSFLRVLLAMAAQVFDTIVFAVVLSLLVGPIYTWLGRSR